MEIINRIATVNLDTPHGIAPSFRFIFSKEDGSGYDLSGKSVSFYIFDDRLSIVYDASGDISISGNIIDILIEDDRYSAIRESPKHQYKYNLTIGEDFRVQGRYRSVIRAGPACLSQYDPQAVKIAICSVAVQVSLAATAGPQGPQGPPGTARAEYVGLPASEELAGLFRRSEGSTFDLLEQCRRVGAGQWAWCPISKTEWP
jgi:hypothetical protein